MDFPRFLFPGLLFFLEIDMIITQKKFLFDSGRVIFLWNQSLHYALRILICCRYKAAMQNY